MKVTNLLKKINFKLLIASLIFVFGIYIYGVENLTIYTEDSPPDQIINEKGELSGFAVEIVREIQKRVGTNYKIEVVPWARGYNDCLTKPNIVLFAMSRTAERNDKFQWVGPIGETAFGFYAKKDSKIEINSIEDAKKLKAIGVYLNDVRDLYLTKKGFKNLERVSNDVLNYKKLAADRIDVLTASQIEMPTVARQAGFTEKDFKLLYIFLRVQKYIAFSLGTPKEVVDKWQNALNDMKKDGTFKNILKKYYPESNFNGEESKELP